MSFEQTDYARRLPYGYWFSPAQGREYLFDRGYNAIASRALDEPWAVTVYQVRKYRDAGEGRVEMHYYNDGNSAFSNPATAATCEKVLARFVLGRDVRYWLPANAGAKPLPSCLLPRTGGKYIPRALTRRRLEAMSAADCVAASKAPVRTVSELLQ